MAGWVFLGYTTRASSFNEDGMFPHTFFFFSLTAFIRLDANTFVTPQIVYDKITNNFFSTILYLVISV